MNRAIKISTQPTRIAALGSLTVFSIGDHLGLKHGLLAGFALTLAGSPSAPPPAHHLAQT